MDPNFCKEAFLKECERELIPNILEAYVRCDLEVLQDWCFEAPFNLMATPIRQAQQLGYTCHSRVLDIDDIGKGMGGVARNFNPWVPNFYTSCILRALVASQTFDPIFLQNPWVPMAL